MKNNHEISLCLNRYSLRTAHYNGKPHLVAPVVLLTTGVHCGSGGCLLYTNEELSRFPSAWDGRPLMLDHPQIGGVPCSANNPEILERQSIGRIWNCYYQDGKLAGEIWVDPDRAASLAPDVLVALRNGRPLEVSTGLWSDDEPVGGAYKGKQYQAIARNIRSDHLAVFSPNSGTVGACDYETGKCGVRANCQHEYKKEIDMEEALEIPRFFWDAPADVQRRIRGHLNVNHGPEIAESRIKRMTAQEALELDRSLRGCGGAEGGAGCGGCGDCGSPKKIVGNDDTESPLEIPVMRFEPFTPKDAKVQSPYMNKDVKTPDADEDEEPLEVPEMVFGKGGK